MNATAELEKQATNLKPAGMPAQAAPQGFVRGVEWRVVTDPDEIAAIRAQIEAVKEAEQRRERRSVRRRIRVLITRTRPGVA